MLMLIPPLHSVLCGKHPEILAHTSYLKISLTRYAKQRQHFKSAASHIISLLPNTFQHLFNLIMHKHKHMHIVCPHTSNFSNNEMLDLHSALSGLTVSNQNKENSVRPAHLLLKMPVVTLPIFVLV